MVFPWQLSTRLSYYLTKNTVTFRKRYPLVLMLEPLFRCNLACAGCGRIREYKDIMDQTLSTEECLASVKEAGAPVVSLTGGEPLLHPEVEKIVQGITAQKRFVYLCTNGLLLEKSLPKFKPSPYLSFVVHLDGLAPMHDSFAGRPGTFDTAFGGIKAAKKAGFQVRTNTTIYKNTSIPDTEKLFGMLMDAKVNGLMVSPAFSYEKVDNDVFLSRDEMHKLFLPLYQSRRKYPFYNTPLYLGFLAGRQNYHCTPWSNPTRNPKGWKRPCYLITDGHCSSFKELMEETDWNKYGAGKDPRCANCMVHCGFEASAIGGVFKSPVNLWETVRWNFF